MEFLTKVSRRVLIIQKLTLLKYVHICYLSLEWQILNQLPQNKEAIMWSCVDVRIRFPSQRVSSMVKSFTYNLHAQNNNHNNITVGATFHLYQTTSEKLQQFPRIVFFLFLFFYYFYKYTLKRYYLGLILIKT